MPEHNPNAWLQHQSQHFKDFFPRWDYVEKLDSGAYVYRENVRGFVHKRDQGEAEGMYLDRIKNLRPAQHFTNIMGRYIGQFMHGDSSLVITYENEEKKGGLGDPLDPESRAFQIKNDVDGKGTTLALWQSRLLHALLIYEEIYVLVQAPTFEHGPIHWIIIPPTLVTDIQESDGVLIAIKIENEVDKRGSLMEKPVTWQQVDLYEVGTDGENGRQRRWEWEGENTKDAEKVVDVPFERFAQAGSSEQRLPIVRSRLGLHSYMAYQVALSTVSLLNQQSEVKNRLRIAATPAIIEKKKGTKQGSKSTNADKRAQGWSWLTIDIDESIEFLNVPVEGVAEALSIIEDERKDLYTTTFQSYEDRAREATATEINAEVLAGQIAFLTLLALRFDPIIQECFFQSEQIEHPTDPSQWNVVQVKRDGPFRPDDTESAAERDKEAFFGDEGLPFISEEAAIAFFKAQYPARGIELYKNFEDDVRRWFRLMTMSRDISTGTGRREAALAAGLEGEALEMAIRTDNVPTNGEMQ